MGEMLVELLEVFVEGRQSKDWNDLFVRLCAFLSSRIQGGDSFTYAQRFQRQAFASLTKLAASNHGLRVSCRGEQT